MTRFGWVILTTVVLVLASPPPARADSAQPGNYRSEVTGLEPATGSVDFGVVGGDTFLSVTAEPGTEVQVPGYQDEPYVRIGPDGEVEVNRNSPSRWINEDRFARTGIPPHASAEASPDWEVVASDGTYGWHDHRIHWMSPEPPPAVDTAARAIVFDWVVPVVVDGEPVDVLGTLEWVPAISPFPWVVLSLVVAIVSYFVGGWSLVVGALFASFVGLSQALASPLGMWSEYLAWVPPVLGIGLAGAGLLIARVSTRLLAGAAVIVAVWAVLRLSSLWMPVLPSPLPAWLERTGVAVVAGASLAVLVVVFRRVSSGADTATAP